MSVLESRVESGAVKWAKVQGFIIMKVTPAGQRGWPDRVFINRRGVHVYVEFKRLGKDLVALQEHRRITLRNQSCHVYGPVDTVEEAIGILQRYV